jgi:hypothetical protein
MDYDRESVYNLHEKERNLEESGGSHDEAGNECHTGQRSHGSGEGTVGSLSGSGGLGTRSSSARGSLGGSDHASSGGGGVARTGRGNGSTSRGSRSASDFSGDGSVELASHASESVLGGEGGEGELGVGGVLEGEGRVLDEVDGAVGSDRWVDGVCDLSVLTDIHRGRDVLEAGLGLDTAGAKVDGASADHGQGWLVSVIVPSDCALLASGTRRACNGLGDVDGARHLGDEGGSDDGENS